MRRVKPKWISSTGILLFLGLIGLSTVWTSEWMDRLKFFGDSLNPPDIVTPRKSIFEEAEAATTVFDVPEEEEVEVLGEDSEIEEIEGVLQRKSNPRLSICVVSTNQRTASIFYSGTLKKRGGGKFDYFVTSKSCPNATAESPVTVRMLYQKTIVSLSRNQVDSLFSSQQNLIIVMGDEFCRCPLDICASRAHARQYYSEYYVDYVTKHPRADETPTVYLPLGPRIEFPNILEKDIILSSQRKYLFNLIVSPTSPGRKRLAALVNKAKFNNVFVHVTPAFVGNVTEAKGFVQPDEYRNVLLSSKFTLCPAGHNPEAFRIYEACESGSIPIIVKDEEYQTHGCKDAFAPLLTSGAPFIVLKSWDELETALQPFIENPLLIDENQKRLKAWYSRYWSEVARDFECALANRIGSLNSGFLSSNYDMPECGDDEEEEGEEKNVETAKVPEIYITPSKKISPTPLIVGCGRTGTLSLSHYLVNAVGVKSVHEKLQPWAVSVSWLYAVPDAVYYPFEGKMSPSYRKWKAKRLKLMNLPLFNPVVHIVRHPLKVISSTRRCFCGRGTRSTGLGQFSDSKSWQFLEKYVKMPQENLPYDSLVRSMTYWYEWNKLIERRHQIEQRFRIEDLDPKLLVEALKLEVPPGLELPHRIPRAPSHVSPEAERVALPDATWRDLYLEDAVLANKIFELAKEYGYETQAEKLEDLFS